MNKQNKKVSILIPSWFEKNQNGKYGENETYYIASRCLQRLLKVTDRNLIELIIVNNGSTLTTNDIPDNWMPLEDYWKSADTLIKNDKNEGFGPAINSGIRVAKGEYIIQMNNDIIVLDGWLEAILEAFEHTELDPPIGMVMPNLIKRNYQLDCLNEKGRIDIEKVFNLKRKDLVLRNEGVYEPGAEFGSCFCMKKELADKLIEKDGFFFDPQFLMGFSEDRDLYKRIRLLGYETFRTNLTRVGHIGNLTISKLENKTQYTHTNREKLKKKWNMEQEEETKEQKTNKQTCPDCKAPVQFREGCMSCPVCGWGKCGG